MNGPFQHVSEAVAWIEGQAGAGIKPGLERMRRLMERLDHPHRSLKWIHVAGTNGKGSVCAFLESVLRKGGYDTGMFTSPYLNSFQERISYNGEPIPDDVLTGLANRLYPLAQELASSDLGAPSMFELTTAIAIVYYATFAYPDYIVWETGLGGRLDSTNIVVPVVSVITPVGMDHMEFLGSTLESVASEKAGIIKRGVPVITAVQKPEVMEVLRQKAKEQLTTLYEPGKHYNVERLILSTPERGDRFRFDGPFGVYESVESGLLGPHQCENAAAALMTIEVLRQYMALVLEADDIIGAFREVRWPGRMEWLNPERTLLADGAHNPHGAMALAETLRAWKEKGKSYTFLIAMSGTKDAEGILCELMPLAERVILTQADIRQAMPVDRLETAVRNVMREMNRDAHTDHSDSVQIPAVTVIADWSEAIRLWQDTSGADGIGIACGSLYWVADVRSVIAGREKPSKGW